MHARLRLDIGWRDLGRAALACATATGRAQRTARIERRFSPRGEAFVALSVRSGLDLYLTSLALPRGSEVVVSGLTIPHVVQILEMHGLRVVPLPLDPATLAPPEGALERCIGPRSRALLFAHLFGQRADVAGLFARARARGLLVWEDCAQAYTGDGWRGDPAADLALFSFGLIKTATAIQGGILCVRDEAVRKAMVALQARWPIQPRTDFARRVFKTAGLLALSGPIGFALFVHACRIRGRDLDQVLHSATRGFPGPDFMQRLRHQPSAPLLALLERRIVRATHSLAAEKRLFGEELLAMLGSDCELMGRAARERHHWVLGIGSDEPHQLVRRLRAAGFDATARSSLIPVAPSGGGEAPDASRNLLERLVYVPLALRASRAERAELARILRAEATLDLEPAGRLLEAQPPGA